MIFSSFYCKLNYFSIWFASNNFQSNQSWMNFYFIFLTLSNHENPIIIWRSDLDSFNFQFTFLFRELRYISKDVVAIRLMSLCVLMIFKNHRSVDSISKLKVCFLVLNFNFGLAFTKFFYCYWYWHCLQSNEVISLNWSNHLKDTCFSKLKSFLANIFSCSLTVSSSLNSSKTYIFRKAKGFNSSIISICSLLAFDWLTFKIDPSKDHSHHLFLSNSYNHWIRPFSPSHF